MASGNIFKQYENSDASVVAGYVKFPNGIMIAWTSKGFNPAITTAYGSMYYSSQLTLPDWDAPFYSSAPHVVVSVSGGTDVFLGRVTGTSTTTAGKVYAYSPVSVANASVTVEVIAIGRWK